MIYTVTFNPSLDYIVSVENFQLGLTNRTSSEMLLPGGKGINVSTVLMNLGIESTALGFTAGFTEDLTKFMVIWLNEKWMIGENLHQKISRRVHCDSYASAVQHSHDLLVGIIRHG